MPVPQKFTPKGMVMRCGKPCGNSVVGMRKNSSSSNGTRRRTLRTRRRRSPTAATGKCGGAVIRGIPGRRPFTAEPAVLAAPTAAERKWDRATISRRCTRSWPLNGTRGKTRRESPPNSLREATPSHGGSVRKDTPGGPRSNPGSPAAAARSVWAGWLWREQTRWPTSLRSCHANGTWIRMPR